MSFGVGVKTAPLTSVIMLTDGREMASECSTLDSESKRESATNSSLGDHDCEFCGICGLLKSLASVHGLTVELNLEPNICFVS